MSYAIHLTIVCLLYGVLAMSLSVIVNWCGTLSLMHGAFYGIGAYVAGMLGVKYGADPELSLAFAVVAGGLLGSIVSALVPRARGDDFVLLVFASQLIFTDLIKGIPEITGGNNGLRIDNTWSHPALPSLLIASVFATICLLLLHRVHRSAFGRALKVMREDEVLCAGVGHRTLSLRTKAFALSGAMAAGVGAIYANYIGFIDPSSFGLSQSIYILAIVMLGGTRNILAPFGSAIILVLLPELLRFVEIADVNAGYIRQIAYGVIMLVMIWRGLAEDDRGVMSPRPVF